MPVFGALLRGLAAVAAYSRVHTDVHYPGDVIIGTTIGPTTALAASRRFDGR
jgi:undecaprenyl-diphosphatase